jgi:hypothetical protein
VVSAADPDGRNLGFLDRKQSIINTYFLDSAV